MKIFYSDVFVLPLPSGHRFPMRKYSMLHAAVVSEAEARGWQLEVPPPASDRELRRVHSEAWLRRVCHGQLTRQEERRLGLPWSPQMVARSRHSVGATLAACRAAMLDAVAVNLAGGTHHAFADRGEGYCVFNDVAVALRALQAEQLLSKALVVDCDVHQGDGTASIFAEDPSVFTLSLHGRRNYPLRKEQGDMDVALEDGTGDDEYLEVLGQALPRALAVAGADLVVYLAGADPYVEDRLGRLALSKQGLAARDQLVFQLCRRQGLPIAVVMAGGYAPRVEDIVEIHLQTVRTASEAQTRWPHGRARSSESGARVAPDL